MEKIKTTLIGAGYRGKQLLQFLQNFPFFEVMAVADPYIEETDIPRNCLLQQWRRRLFKYA